MLYSCVSDYKCKVMQLSAKSALAKAVGGHSAHKSAMAKDIGGYSALKSGVAIVAISVAPPVQRLAKKNVSDIALNVTWNLNSVDLSLPNSIIDSAPLALFIGVGRERGTVRSRVGRRGVDTCRPTQTPTCWDRVWTWNWESAVHVATKTLMTPRNSAYCS